MNQSNSPETLAILDQAVAGDKKALETILVSVQDLVFNLSLRMLGAFADAEDATQDILIKVITHLSAFKKESSFTTWVFRIAVNHLKNYQKHLFAHAPLNFSYYAHDITEGQLEEIPDLAQDVERPVLSEELKLSCTNVMLQCLDTQSRCIFVLGTMFHLDSRIAGDLLGMSAQAYRQKLSRTRKKMAAFLQAYCGEYGKGACKCQTESITPSLSTASTHTS